MDLNNQQLSVSSISTIATIAPTSTHSSKMSVFPMKDNNLPITNNASTTTTAAETIESDELNDNISVLSLTSSIDRGTGGGGSGGSGGSSKLLAMAKRLKQENVLLRESLEKAKASDVAVLRTKLRAAQADLQRLREINADLRERNEVLEDRLAKVLSDQMQQQQTGAGSSVGKATDVRTKLAQALKRQRHSTLTSTSEKSVGQVAVVVEQQQGEEGEEEEEEEGMKASSSNGTLESEEQTIVKLQRRLRHTESLLKAYEVKINMLERGEREDGKRAEEEEGEEKEGGGGKRVVAIDEVVEGGDNRRSLLTKRKTRKRFSEEEVKAFLNDARAADGRTIQELAQEVKRLVALLPRPLIDDESSPTTSAVAPISTDTLSHEETENRKVIESVELETRKAIDAAEQEREERMQERDRRGWWYLTFFATSLVVVIVALVQLIQAFRTRQGLPNAE
eukprot:gene274-291_t